MNVDIHKLREAVQLVRHTLSKDKAIESYRWICFRERRITTFDGNTATVTASPLPELECVLLGDKFVTMLDVLNDGRSARFELVEGWLNVKAGRYETRIPTFDLRDYPTIEISGSKKFCEATNLVECFKAIKPAIEKDISSPIGGVGMRGSYLYATDGKRISRAKLSHPVKSSISISKTGADQLTRLGQPDHLFEIGNMVGGLYAAQKTLVMTRTLEAMFPYDAVDTAFEDGKHRVVLEVPNELLPAVERVRAMNDNEESAIHLECNGEVLTLRCESDTGTAKDSIALQAGAPFKIKVHADRLRASLRALKPETIDLSDVIYGDARMLRFSGEGYEHAMALMN